MPRLRVEAEFEGPAFELFQAMADLTKTFGHRYFRELEACSPLNIQIVSDEQREAEVFEALKDKPIQEFSELPTLILNCLGRVGLVTVGDVAARKESELRKIPTLGKTSFWRLKAAFEARGLHPWG